MSQQALYEQAAAAFGPALERLAGSYEADPELRRDLLQDIHLALWRSLRNFAEKCSLRTWVYRVAHNVAASHVGKHRRARAQGLVSLDEIDEIRDAHDTEAAAGRQQTLARLYTILQQLKPLDRELILLYLEGLDAASIAEITGISARNVATKVHRIKRLLAERFKGDRHGG